MEYTTCRYCDHCNTHRKNEQGQVRCTRFSRFVNSNDRSCEEYRNMGLNEAEVNELLYQAMRGGK